MDMIENLHYCDYVKPFISQPENLTIKIVDTPEFLEYHFDILDQSDIRPCHRYQRRAHFCNQNRLFYSVPYK